MRQQETLEEIEEILIQADVGIDPTMRIIDKLRERMKSGEKVEDPENYDHKKAGAPIQHRNM